MEVAINVVPTVSVLSYPVQSTVEPVTGERTAAVGHLSTDMSKATKVSVSGASSRNVSRHKRVVSSDKGRGPAVSVSPTSKKKETKLPAVAGALEEKHDGHLAAPPAERGGGHKRNRSIPNISGSAHDYVSDDESDFTAGNVNFEELDAQVTKSRTFQDMWRVVRLVSAASSHRSMVDVLEREAAGLVRAASVRLWSTSDGSSFRRGDEVCSSNLGITAEVFRSSEIVNISKTVDVSLCFCATTTHL
jgi:hypothetical protein